MSFDFSYCDRIEVLCPWHSMRMTRHSRTIPSDELANVAQYLAQLCHVVAVPTEFEQHEAERHAQRRTCNLSAMFIEKGKEFVCKSFHSRNSDIVR